MTASWPVRRFNVRRLASPLTRVRQTFKGGGDGQRHQPRSAARGRGSAPERLAAEDIKLLRRRSRNLMRPALSIASSRQSCATSKSPAPSSGTFRNATPANQSTRRRSSSSRSIYASASSPGSTTLPNVCGALRPKQAGGVQRPCLSLPSGLRDLPEAGQALRRLVSARDGGVPAACGAYAFDPARLEMRASAAFASRRPS